jgi:phosphate transport system substrate-binding protein
MGLVFKWMALPGAFFVCLLAMAGEALAEDSTRPGYTKVADVSGNLSSVGSDTLANLVTLWGEQFKRLYPNVNIQIQAAGSSTAPPALSEGTASLGPMSRKMKDNELAAFEAQYGYKPTAVPVAIDALAVFVHKDNPLLGLTLPQVDAIFSSTRKCGYPEELKEWGQLGNGGGWQFRDIQLFGRNSVSGTYGYFKDKALCRGDYKNSVNEQPGSASVVQAVSTSVNGIGYSGIGYKTASVRPVPLAKDANSPYVDATPENTLSGAYPLARFLYIYVNKKPNEPIAKLEREYLKLVLSEQGQATVVKDGYIPLPASSVVKIRQKFGLD